MTQSRSEQQRTLFNNSHVNAVGISYLVSYLLAHRAVQLVREKAVVLVYNMHLAYNT